MTKPYKYQPLINQTIFITNSGKFCIRADNGTTSVNGQPSLEAAIKAAKNVFGMALSFRGTTAGPKIIDGVVYDY